MIQLKEGVSLRHLTPQGLLIAVVVDQTYAANNIPVCTITSGDDGKHRDDSKHYAGNALDFRIRGFLMAKAGKIRAEAQAALGRDFDLILEPDHIHAEYDPKDRPSPRETIT